MHWGGCAATETSWVDREDILDPSLIAELRDRQAGALADAEQTKDAPPPTPAPPPHPTQDASSSGTATPSSELAAGVRVRARAEATSIGPHRVWQTKWYSGVVRRVHDDGSADVDYDDGDSEERVDPGFIRVLAHDRAPGGAARKRRRSDAKTEAADVAEASWKQKLLRMTESRS